LREPLFSTLLQKRNVASKRGAFEAEEGLPLEQSARSGAKEKKKGLVTGGGGELFSAGVKGEGRSYGNTPPKGEGNTHIQ